MLILFEKASNYNWRVYILLYCATHIYMKNRIKNKTENEIAEEAFLADVCLLIARFSLFLDAEFLIFFD